VRCESTKPFTVPQQVYGYQQQKECKNAGSDWWKSTAQSNFIEQWFQQCL